MIRAGHLLPDAGMAGKKRTAFAVSVSYACTEVSRCRARAVRAAVQAAPGVGQTFQRGQRVYPDIVADARRPACSQPSAASREETRASRFDARRSSMPRRKFLPRQFCDLNKLVANPFKGEMAGGRRRAASSQMAFHVSSSIVKSNRAANRKARSIRSGMAEEVMRGSCGVRRMRALQVRPRARPVRSSRSEE